MPVHFKSTSEYKQKFGSAQADDAPAGPSAGIESDKLALTVEPPLQHKKRLEGPPTSLSTNYFSVPSKEMDYALLGQQEKFAPNVRYQPKPSHSGQKIYKNKENFDNAPPPSKQLKMQKRIKPLFKERHPTVSRSPPRQAPTTSTILSPPPAPRVPKESLDIKEALRDKDLKDVLGDQAPPPKEAGVKTRESDAQLEKGRGNNMNEFVQTNMKKGVALSGPEAPAEYALKYKAGVAPPRPVKKFSEYQRQFQWKDGMKASPLLAAEEIVYKSNAELGPYKTDAIPKLSEYRQQFQKWKAPDFAADVNLNVSEKMATAASQQKQEKKRTVAKRSKSAGAVLHQEPEEVDDEMGAEGADSEEQLKTKLLKSHGKIKRLGSEYKANFKSPLRYSYAEGAWRGAAPPQMMPQTSSAENTDANNDKENNNNNNASEEAPLSNWFAEVLELRRRAQEYRKRAQGTHFSREHLVQLMAKQNECWDLHSDGSSTVRALNLETSGAHLRGKEKNLAQTAPADLVDALSHEATEGDSPLMSDVEEAEPQRKEGKKKKGRRGGKSKGGRKSRKMAWLEEQKESVAEQRRQLEETRQREDMKDDDDNDSEGLVGKEGRLPTPLLQGDSSARRHHLDLTTPAVGGAILTCPPSKSSKLIITSRSGDSYVTASDDLPVRGEQKKYNMDKLLTLPAGGKPSPDTHALRDDVAESDQALVTQYIVSPPLPGSEEDKENKGQRKKKSKGQKPGSLTTIKEGYGKTYQPKPFLDLDDIKAGTLDKKDDDVLSVSLMSVASSGSLASEVLERARKRQEFWNKKDS
ncbi:nuclear protein MDM1 isoform X2 [Aplysia californica]|uniref:Nuclear protein MDM1 n=1 Tax=Aplysia californica TaxID=6500 RepID=A0ABM0JNI8_APLCA|nr:nuclear protein MDM1 isoform X2 [Aplysia californica]